MDPSIFEIYSYSSFRILNNTRLNHQNEGTSPSYNRKRTISDDNDDPTSFIDNIAKNNNSSSSTKTQSKNNKTSIKGGKLNSKDLKADYNNEIIGSSSTSKDELNENDIIKLLSVYDSSGNIIPELVTDLNYHELLIL